nr:hypothetical protein [Aliiruegeria lutimaris]
MRTRRHQNNKDALNAFIATKAEIDEMVRRLQALSDEHFNTHPASVSWCDVDTLQSTAARLREVCDSVFREGDYAD